MSKEKGKEFGVFEKGANYLGEQLFETQEFKNKLQEYKSCVADAEKVLNEKREGIEKSDNLSLKDIVLEVESDIKQIKELLDKTEQEKNSVHDYKIQQHINSLRTNIEYVSQEQKD